MCVRAFVPRHERLRAALADFQEAADADPEALLSGLPPHDPAESSAHEAIQALLDDARRAMNERRHADFARDLDSIRELVADAMDELERRDFAWSVPGEQPEWPPLAELSSNLGGFRDEVIRRVGQEDALKLVSLDHRLLRDAVRRRCGELFTMALGGYETNYAIVVRIGDREWSNWFRHDVWLALRDAFMVESPDEAESLVPYAREAIRLQERLLSLAMDERDGDAFRSIREDFAGTLRSFEHTWGVDDWQRSPAAELREQLEQDGRIALMGLGGRALRLAGAGELADPRPYLDVARETYTDLNLLADDIPRVYALAWENIYFFSWLAWDFTPAIDGQVQDVDPQRYPLTYFAVRLLESAREPLPALDLHGTAQRVLDWFSAHAEQLESQVAPDPGISTASRRERALDALRAAVRRDEVSEDEEIIARPLSTGRVGDFIAGVYASRFAADAIERSFARAGAFRYLRSDADGAPVERGFASLERKGWFTESPERDRTYYAPLEGERWGTGLADDTAARLRGALSGAPSMAGIPASADGLLRALDRALDELMPRDEALVLLVGDWADALAELRRSPDRSGAPSWRAGGPEPGVWARYGPHPVVWQERRAAECELYVLDPAGRGCLVRAQADDGRDLAINVGTISAERARRMLDENPDRFPDEPDESSKLRKLQACVTIDVRERTGFRVVDPARARRLVATQP